MTQLYSQSLSPNFADLMFFLPNASAIPLCDWMNCTAVLIECIIEQEAVLMLHYWGNDITLSIYKEIALTRPGRRSKFCIYLQEKSTLLALQAFQSSHWLDVKHENMNMTTDLVSIVCTVKNKGSQWLADTVRGRRNFFYNSLQNFFNSETLQPCMR